MARRRTRSTGCGTASCFLVSTSNGVVVCVDSPFEQARRPRDRALVLSVPVLLVRVSAEGLLQALLHVLTSGAMVPIFLLATAIFLSLSLLRTHLSNNRALVESAERIQQLESQLARLRAEAKRRQERERRERERILPIVVERVLQRVGAMNPEEEPEVEEDVLLV